MQIIEKLFQTLNSEDAGSNPFETKKVKDTHEAFSQKYIFTTKELQDSQNDMWECFAGALQTEREQAFKVGFDTAKKMFLADITE